MPTLLILDLVFIKKYFIIEQPRILNSFPELLCSLNWGISTSPLGLSSPCSRKRFTQKIVLGLPFSLLLWGAGGWELGWGGNSPGDSFPASFKEEASLTLPAVWGRELPCPGEGSIGEGTAFVRWQTPGKNLQSSGGGEDKPWGLDRTTGSPQWFGVAWLRVADCCGDVMVGDRPALPLSSAFTPNIKHFFSVFSSRV